MASNDLGLLASVSLGSSLLTLGGGDLVTNRIEEMPECGF